MKPDKSTSPPSHAGAATASAAGGLTVAVIRYFRISILGTAALLALGVWSFMVMPTTEDPEFDVNQCRVVTRFPGASADKVESLVSRPLEDAIAEVENIDTIWSISSTNLSLLKITVDEGADPLEVLEDVKENIKDAEGELPSGANEPEVFGINNAEIPVAIVSLFGIDDLDVLEPWAETLKDRIEDIDTVKLAEIVGMPERQVVVSVDAERLSSYRIPLRTVADILALENAGVPGGKMDVGSKRYMLKNPNEFESLDDVRDTVIGSFGGTLVQLDDVARVEYGFEEARYKVRTQGQTALELTVQKRDGTQTSAVAAKVRNVVEEIQNDLPPGVKIELVSDRGKSVDALMGILMSNAVSGGVIVVLVVSLFLGIREGLVVSVSIPLSVLVAIILMFVFDLGLTQVSIFGLVLALGMLVDSSLVIVENIGRHIEEGERIYDAVCLGVEEVRTPVFASVLTTIAAFIPMMFLKGPTGMFIMSMPLTVMFSLCGSMLVAITIIPLLCYVIWRYFPPKHAHVEEESRAMVLYLEVVKFALRNRLLTVVVMIVAFAASLMLIPKLGFQLFPKDERNIFLINIRLPRDANLETTELITSQVEGILAAESEIRNFTSTIGKGGPQVYYNEEPDQESPSFAQILVNLKDDLEIPTEQYVAGLRTKLHTVGGASIEPKIFAQGPVGGAPIQIRVYGDELDTLSEMSAEIMDRVNDVEGLVDLRDTLGKKSPQIVLDVNKDKAALLGVDSYAFSSTIFMALNGEEATRYRPQGKDDMPMVVKVDEQSITEVSDLTKLYLPSRGGAAVPFSELASIRYDSEFGKIDRRHRQRVVVVEADTSRLPAKVLTDVRIALADFAPPAGYTLELGGKHEVMKTSFASLGQALVLAILLIYAILAVQFNSFMQPFVILFTVPFGVIGAVCGLFITGNPFGFMAFIGIVSLTGIIINDSIVLADYANYLQRVKGMTIYQALIEAGKTRFRPVITTSVTTIAGLMPLAIWGGSLWSPLASAIIFGLIGATVLILVVLPVVYSLLIRQKEGRRSFRLLAKLRQRVLSQDF